MNKFIFDIILMSYNLGYEICSSLINSISLYIISNLFQFDYKCGRAKIILFVFVIIFAK